MPNFVEIARIAAEIWRFLKMAAVCHLGFVMLVLRRVFGGMCHCAKFGWNWCSRFDNMHVFRLCEFGLKTSIHWAF